MVIQKKRITVYHFLNELIFILNNRISNRFDRGSNSTNMVFLNEIIRIFFQLEENPVRLAFLLKHLFSESLDDCLLFLNHQLTMAIRFFKIFNLTFHFLYTTLEEFLTFNNIEAIR